jgi:hypothetical protein
VAFRGCLILLGISEAEENEYLHELWTYLNLLLRCLRKFPQNVTSGAMMLIHKLLKIRSLTDYSSGGGTMPERLLTLAVTAFYVACKDLDLPISTKDAALLMYAVEQMIRRFGRPVRNIST